MKIVHAVRSDGFAGVERYIAMVSAVQARRGMAVHVVGGHPARMRSELSGSGVTWEPAVSTWDVIRALARLRRVSLVHAHMTAAEIAAVLAARAPVISTRHFGGRRGSTPMSRMVGQLTSHRIAGQVAISEFVARTIEGAASVIHPGVQTVSTPYRSSWEREPVVLIAQRLEVEKRTELGLRMWAASGLADRGWRLAVSGSGALHAELEEQASQLGVRASCDFLGSREDVAELMASASIFLAPRPDEPYGLSVVEAMSHGTPVVAASGGGHRETVGACPSAVLVPADDPASAGARLRDLAADSRRRDLYGLELRALQQRLFSVDGHVDRLEEFYRDVVIRLA